MIVGGWLWLNDPRLFAELTLNEQWSLHDFFGPDYDWPDDKMLIRRGYVTKVEPSLPQKAGRALAKFWGTTATRTVKKVQAAKAPQPVIKRRQPEDRKLMVRAVARPEPSVKLLSRASMRQALSNPVRRRQAWASAPPVAHDALAIAKPRPLDPGGFSDATAHITS